jgi:hypothetical protein
MSNFSGKRLGGPNSRSSGLNNSLNNVQDMKIHWEQDSRPISPRAATGTPLISPARRPSRPRSESFPTLTKPLLDNNRFYSGRMFLKPNRLNPFDKTKGFENPFERKKLGEDKKGGLPLGNPNANPFSNPDRPYACCDNGCKVYCCRHKPW